MSPPRAAALPRAVLLPVSFALLVALADWGPALGLVRVRVVLLVVAAIFAASLWQLRHARLLVEHRLVAASFFALSLLVCAAGPLLRAAIAAGSTVWAVATSWIPILLGWSLFLWVVPDAPEPDGAPPDAAPRTPRSSA